MKTITVLVTNEFANEVRRSINPHRGQRGRLCVLATMFRNHFYFPIEVGDEAVYDMFTGTRIANHDGCGIVHEFDASMNNCRAYTLPDTLVTLEAPEELLREIPEEIVAGVELMEEMV